MTHKTDDGFLINIVEKPSEDEALKYKGKDGAVRVSMNLWLFDYDILFPYIENCPVNPKRNEKELTDAVSQLIADHPKGMKALPWSEQIPDLTSKDDIIPTMNFLKTHFSGFNW